MPLFYSTKNPPFPPALKKQLKRVNAVDPFILLAWRDAFRTYDWEKAFPSPEATISQVKQLLSLI